MTESHGKRRVALVVASTYPRWCGDFEPSFVHELARRMVHAFHVVVVTPRSPGAASREFMDGVDVIRYGYAPKSLETLVYGGGIASHLRRSPWKWLLLPTFFLAQIAAVVRAAIVHKPAILHAHWVIPQGAIATLTRGLLRCKTPLLVTAHGSDVFGLPGVPFRTIRAWVGRRVDAWTVVGDALAERLVAEGTVRASDRMAVMPMGVDLAGAFASSGKRRDPNMILFVGRLVSGKGLDVLIEAMTQVVRAIPSAHLEIVGDGPLRSTLESRVRELGISDHVKFHGALSNRLLPELFRSASVSVAPFTSAQGFGLTIVEALGCGCPIVTTPLAAVEEMTRHVSLIRLVEPGNAQVVAQATIDLLLGPPSEDETVSSVSYVRARHDWAVVAESYIRLYESLCGPPNGVEHAASL